MAWVWLPDRTLVLPAVVRNERIDLHAEWLHLLHKSMSDFADKIVRLEILAAAVIPIVVMYETAHGTANGIQVIEEREFVGVALLTDTGDRRFTIDAAIGNWIATGVEQRLFRPAREMRQRY